MYYIIAFYIFIYNHTIGFTDTLYWKTCRVNCLIVDMLSVQESAIMDCNQNILAIFFFIYFHIEHIKQWTFFLFLLMHYSRKIRTVCLFFVEYKTYQSSHEYNGNNQQQLKWCMEMIRQNCANKTHNWNSFNSVHFLCCLKNSTRVKS